MKKLVPFLVALLCWGFSFPQCPSVSNLATDGPGYIQLSPSPADYCMDGYCQHRPASASIYFDPGIQCMIGIVTQDSLTAVWHLPNCDTILIAQCSPVFEFGDTSYFGVDYPGGKVCTIFSQAPCVVWGFLNLSLPIPPSSITTCIPTGIPPARETTHAYLKIDTWEAFQPPLEPGLYFVLDSQTMMPTGRKIRVFD